MKHKVFLIVFLFISIINAQEILLPVKYRGTAKISGLWAVALHLGDSQILNLCFSTEVANSNKKNQINSSYVKKPKHIAIIIAVPTNTENLEQTSIELFQNIFNIYESSAKKKPFSFMFWKRKKVEPLLLADIQGQILGKNIYVKLTDKSGKNAVKEVEKWINWNAYRPMSNSLKKTINEGNKKVVFMRIDSYNNLGIQQKAFTPPISISFKSENSYIPVGQLQNNIPLVFYFLSERSLNISKTKSMNKYFKFEKYKSYRENIFIPNKKLPNETQLFSEHLKEKARYRRPIERKASRKWYVNRFFGKETATFEKFQVQITPAD